MRKIAIDYDSLDRRRAWDHRPRSLHDQDAIVLELRQTMRRRQAWRMAWSAVGVLLFGSVVSALVIGMVP